MTSSTLRVVRCAVLVSLLVVGSAPVIAQSFPWARTMGSADYEIALDAHASNTGLVLTTGYAAEDPANGCGTTYAPGLLDMLLSAHDAAGNCVWTLIDGGPQGDEIGRAVTTDANGNVYVTGSYNATATFGTFLTVPVGMEDVFVVKYDATGAFQWFAHAGGGFQDEGTGVAVDAAGNTYVCGYFKTFITFGTTTLGSVGNRDAFLAKLDTAGNWVWAQRAGGFGGEEALGVDVDAAGDVYMTGWCSSSPTDFGTHLVNPAGADLFLAKYDPTGQCTWVRIGGGNGTDQGNAVAVDASGNSYVAGWISTDTATFDGTQVFTDGPYDDAVLVSYDALGSLRWVSRAGGPGFDQAWDVDLNTKEEPVITGNFTDSMSIAGGVLQSAGDVDVFAAAFDTSGLALWALAGGGAGYDPAGGIAVDGDDAIYLGGGYDTQADFGPNALLSYGSGDHYLVKIDDLSTGVTSPDGDGHGAVLTWDGNGALGVKFTDGWSGSVPYAVYDATGRQVAAGVVHMPGTIDASRLGPGTYAVTFRGDGIKGTGRMVLSR